MERRSRKSPEQPKELWQQKGWRKKLVNGYTIYNGHFTVGSGEEKQSFVGSIYEHSIMDKKLIHVFVQSHRPRIFQDLPLTLVNIRLLIFEVDYETPPQSVNEALKQTEELLGQIL